MSRLLRLFFLMSAAAVASFGQFQMTIVDSSGEHTVPALYQLGSFQPGEAATASLRIRNTSDQTATLNFLTVKGTGFSLSGLQPLPVAVAPQQALNFQVVFQSAMPGAYSAALDSEGISVILSATVVPSLTYEAGSQILGSAPVDFGSVELGSLVSRHFTVENRTEMPLSVPAISVSGAGFSLAGSSPGGTALQPRQTAGFDVRYEPPGEGHSTGSLVIGGRVYGLAGTGVAITLPNPSLQVSLPQPAGGQQGIVTVTFDAPARTSGIGFVSLEFQPQAANAVDAAIQFATGGTTASFSVSPGDTQANFPFQAGTTAGTLTFTVTMGGHSGRTAISIPPAAVTLTASQGIRAPGAIEIRLTGFDNTRTIGRLTYRFFDISGNPIAAPFTVDGAADFVRFFQTSNAGGNFQLSAVFPVTGDSSQIGAFEATISNSAGAAQTGRIRF